MKILITGASGMLGHSLVRVAVSDNRVWGTYRSFPVEIPGSDTFAIDLRNESQLRERMRAVMPEAVIHTAAWTDVDQCEKEPVEARRVNTLGTKSLALLASELRAAFVYISTDYVFDGRRGNYNEKDVPAPVNEYGKTKLLGEEAVRQVCPEALIVRTSLFGFNVQPKAGFVEFVINSSEGKETITRYQDQYFSPIYTADLGRFVLELLRRRSSGLFHIGGGERVSRYEFTLKVADVFLLRRDRIRPAPFVPSGSSAPRPRDTSLCGGKVEEHLGIRLPRIEDGLARLKEDSIIYRGANKQGVIHD